MIPGPAAPGLMDFLARDSPASVSPQRRRLPSPTPRVAPSEAG